MLSTNTQQSNIINITSLLSNQDENYVPILPSQSPSSQQEIAEEHDAQPIKNLKDIIKIRNYFIQNKKYRNNMLFIIGINTGLRCSDLRKLKFSDIIDNNCRFKNELVILEQKTKNTRKVQKNRHIFINKAIKEAVKLYLLNNTNTSLDDYMFKSESNNSIGKNIPMSRVGIQNLLVEAVNELNINIRAGTHCLRKTFSYHMIMSAKDRSRALELLQKMLGHSTISTTLRYAGIDNDELNEAYNNLNLGIMCDDSSEVIEFMNVM